MEQEHSKGHIAKKEYLKVLIKYRKTVVQNTLWYESELFAPFSCLLQRAKFTPVSCPQLKQQQTGTSVVLL